MSCRLPADRGRARAREPRGLLVLALAIAALLSPCAARADDAWTARVRREVMRIEVTVATLDQQKPSGTTLVERLVALNARVVALEKEAGLEPGAISGKDDLGAMTQDIVSLDVRWRRIVAKRAPAPEPKVLPPAPAGPKPTPAPGPGVPVKPAKLAPGQWPPRVAFAATAKLVYEETGVWYETRLDSGEIERNFLSDGFQGKLSFSLRAKGLVKDVRSAKIRVAARLKAPFSDRSDVYRVNDVEWNAENRVFGNDSLRSWIHHDSWRQPGTIRWTGGPRASSMSLDVEAYVLSITLSDGSTVAFEVPEYRTH